MLSWFQYHLKSFWHQGLGVITNNDYHMRQTNSERNQGTQLAQIALNTMPLPRSKSKSIMKGQESPIFCLPRQKGVGEMVKGQSTEQPRNLLSVKKWVVCAIAHFVWDKQLCICS